MLEFLKQLLFEIEPRIDEGKEAGAGGAGGGITETKTEKIKIGGVDAEIPAGVLDAEDITDPEKKAGQSGKSAEAQSKYPDGFMQTVSGKSTEELIEMLHASNQMIGKQSLTIGTLKKGTKRSSTDVKADINKLEPQINSLTKKLEGLNALVDVDEYTNTETEISKLNVQKEKLQSEIRNLEVTEAVDMKFNTEYNEEFLTNQRKDYQDKFGFNFEDDAWKLITDSAREINGSGKLSAESMEAAMIMQLGAERYRKVLSVQSELDTRKKVFDAAGKEIKLAGTERQQGESRIFEEMSPVMQAKVIKALNIGKVRDICKKELGFDPVNL